MVGRRWSGAFGLGALGALLLVGACRTTKVVEKPAEVKATGTITVKVTPANAKVTIDGQPAADGLQLPVGKHTVHAEARGYEPQDQVVELAGPQAAVELVLKKLQGTLEVRVNVPADCEADDLHTAASPSQPGTLTLRPELLEVTCRAPNYRAVSILTRVRAGQTTSETLKLLPSLKTEPNSGLDFIWLPGGEARVGCKKDDKDCGKDERPAGKAKIATFWMGKTEVTVDAYAKCVKEQLCAEPKVSKKKKKGAPEANSGPAFCNWKEEGKGNHPMNCVTWSQANDFCSWIGGRLPTVDEWEYAARGGRDLLYPWGNDLITENRANYCDASCKAAVKDENSNDGFATTAPTGSYPAGMSAEGLLDMAGNVGEWTATDSGTKTEAVMKKIFAGGSWADAPTMLRVSAHHDAAPETRDDTLGFRCVLP